MLGHNYDVIGQGTFAFSAQTGTLFGVVWNAAADGDNLTWKVFLGAGTYQLIYLCTKNSTNGIIDIDIDGVEVASHDEYAASITVNSRFSTTGISITGNPRIISIKLRVDGKNASSTGYQIQMNCLTIVRTA